VSLVRVVIPTYNRAKLIGDAVRSVLFQTLTDFEIIAVDDESMDDTEHVIQNLTAQDARVRYLRNPHGGAAVTRNAAIQYPGTFMYVAFLDSDDVWVDPDHLQIAVTTFTNNPEVSFLFARYETVDYTGYWTADRLCLREARFTWPAQHTTRTTPEGAILIDQQDCFWGMLQGELAPATPTVVLRAASMGHAPWFDPKLDTFEDINFYTHLARYVTFGFFDAVRCQVRCYGDNMTTQADLASPKALSQSRALLLHSKSVLPLCRIRPERALVRRAIANHAYLVGQCLSEQARYREALRAYYEGFRHRPSLPTVKSSIGTVARQTGIPRALSRTQVVARIFSSRQR
jgi:hypothetical protein